MDKAKIKQRVIGVLVLAALLAIIVPWVIDERQGRDLFGDRIRIPEKTEKNTVTHVIPLKDWGDQAARELESNAVPAGVAPTPISQNPAPSSSASPATPTPPLVEAAPVTSAPVQQSSKTVAKPPVSESKPKTETMTVPGATREKEGWVVQLGTFTNERSALELRDRMRQMGYSAFVQPVKQANGRVLLRVRVGPEPSRARANALRNEVEREAKLKAIVQPYP